MRVSRIQNVAWASNVLLLGGVAWVGLCFWHARHAKPAPHGIWATANTDEVGAGRWPGERSAFDDIHLTPINGRLPLPPTPPATKPDLDPIESFKAKLKYLAGVQFPATPEMSLARVSYDGNERWIRPGDHVGPFRLVDFTLVPSTSLTGPDGRPTQSEYATIARLVFRDADRGDLVVVDQPDPTSKPLTTPGKGPFVPEPETPDIKPGPCPEHGPLDQAFLNSAGEWVITPSEQLWIETWGEKHVLPNLGMRPETDASGHGRGVRITSRLESKTPLAPSHGLAVNDVVRSINGVAVNSKEEILQYLRGDGRGLYRYVVVVETNGAESEVVYRVPRAVKSPRD